MRTLVCWVAKPLVAPGPCQACRAESAVAQFLQLLPPSMPTHLPIERAADEMYERWLQEQLAGTVRLSAIEELGARCLAQRAAMFVIQPHQVDRFITFFAGQDLPDQVVGAMAIEPGMSGKSFPMVMGISGVRAIRALIQVLNAPIGTLDASDELIALDPEP
jgi:hypothetical protein